MGWDYVKNVGKEGLVKMLLASWSSDDVSARTIKHALKGNVLWSIREYTYARDTEHHKAGDVERIICCDLLDQNYGGWGYKSLTEAMGPNADTCPTAWFAQVPEPKSPYSADFRERCRARAAEAIAALPNTPRSLART